MTTRAEADGEAVGDGPGGTGRGPREVPSASCTQTAGTAKASSVERTGSAVMFPDVDAWWAANSGW